MITLKQTLITMAAVAVSVCASPLSAGSTATVVNGAPEAAVTESSKPLEGTELKDFKASEPHASEGATDINNATLSSGLVQLTRANPDVNPLTIRGDACHQGKCPDHNAAFDFYEQYTVAPNLGTGITQWFYWGRWNDCGQCGQILTSKDGCFDFTSCGRKQTVCVDTSKSRAHRIWHDLDHKTCYNTDTDFQIGCGSILASNIWYPNGETACNW